MTLNLHYEELRKDIMAAFDMGAETVMDVSDLTDRTYNSTFYIMRKLGISTKPRRKKGKNWDIDPEVKYSPAQYLMMPRRNPGRIYTNIHTPVSWGELVERVREHQPEVEKTNPDLNIGIKEPDVPNGHGTLPKPRNIEVNVSEKKLYFPIARSRPRVGLDNTFFSAEARRSSLHLKYHGKESLYPHDGGPNEAEILEAVLDLVDFEGIKVESARDSKTSTVIITGPINPVIY
jgi:hypothetical protein